MTTRVIYEGADGYYLDMSALYSYWTPAAEVLSTEGVDTFPAINVVFKTATKDAASGWFHVSPSSRINTEDIKASLTETFEDLRGDALVYLTAEGEGFNHG